MENLKLAHTKPVVLIKVQTTGLNPLNDRIIELSFTKINTDGKKQSGTRLVNPGISIPENITKINGITDEMIKGKPAFKEMAADIAKFIDGCDFIGFNISNFDLKFLSHEFNRADVEFTIVGRKVVDIAKMYHAMEPRDLKAAYSFYCGKTMPEKSNSEFIVSMYSDIVNNMMDKYKDTPFVDRSSKSHTIEPTVETLNKIFNPGQTRLDIEGNIVLDANNKPVFVQGKHKGENLSELLVKDKDYYDWLINVSTYAPDTKLVLKKIYTKAKAATAVSIVK